MVLAAVSGVGVDRLDPQQGVVRERVQGGVVGSGGGWRGRGRVGGEQGGVVVFVKVHRLFWRRQHTILTTREFMGTNRNI